MKHHTLVKQERTGDKKTARMEKKTSVCQEDGLEILGHTIPNMLNGVMIRHTDSMELRWLLNLKAFTKPQQNIRQYT